MRAEFSKVKASLDKREKEYCDQTNDLKNAEDEIDELKKLLNVAKDIRRKSVGFLTEEQKKNQEQDTPDGCKQQWAGFKITLNFQFELKHIINM